MQSEKTPYRVGHATSPQASLGLRRLFYCITSHRCALFRIHSALLRYIGAVARFHKLHFASLHYGGRLRASRAYHRAYHGHARLACPLRCASLQRCRRAFDRASLCSVVNALAAPPLRYQSLAVCACGAIDNLNAVHIRGKAACSALLPMSWQSEAAPYRVKHAKKPPIHCVFGISVLCCADCIVTIFFKLSEPYSIVLPFTIKSEGSVLPFLGCLHLTPADVLIQRRTMNIDKLYDFDVLYMEMFSVIRR